MIDSESTAPASPIGSEEATSEPITILDVVKAVFLPPQEAQTIALPDLSLARAFASARSDQTVAPDSLALNAPTVVVYETGPIYPVRNVSTRRLMIMGLGTVGAILAGYFAQSAITNQQNTTMGLLLYSAGFLIWLGLLAFEFAPPDGGLLRRGPSVLAITPAQLVMSIKENNALSRGALAMPSLAFSVATYVLTANNTLSPLAFAAWLLSVIGWMLVAAERRPEQIVLDAIDWFRQLRLSRPKLSTHRWIALASLVAIIAVAVFYRFYQIESIPGEMTSDHVEKLLDAYDVTRGDFSVFFPRNGGREAIQMYLVALASGIDGIGISHLALKLVTATEALLLVPLIILLGRELVDWETGFFAAALLAISWWDTSLGRLGLRIVLTPLVFTLVLICLIRAVRTGSRKSWLWAGVWMGVGVYSYQAMRVAPLVAVTAWLIAVGGPLAIAAFSIWRKTVDAPLKQAIAAHVFARQTLNLVCAALIAVAMFVPMLRFWHDDPASLWNRVVNRTTSNEVAIQGSPSQILADNYVKALGMFNIKGDAAWIAGPPQEPVLDIITGGLFVLGVGAWLIRLRVRRDAVDSFIIVAGLIMLLPSALAIAFPIENPSVTRASGVLPIVFVIAAWPLSLIRQRWTAVIGQRAGVMLSAALIAVLFAASARFNYTIYFEKFDASYRLSALNPGEVATAVRQVIGPKAPLDGVWLVGWPFWHDYRAIGIDLGDVTFHGAILDNNALKAELDTMPEKFVTRPLVFIFFDEDTKSRELLEQRFPDGTARRYIGASVKHNFYLFVVPSK